MGKININTEKLLSPGILLKVALLFIVGGFLTVLLTENGVSYSVVYAFIPLGLLIFLFFLKNTEWLIYTLLVITYFMMGITRYIYSFPTGLMVDAVVLLAIFILIIRSFSPLKMEWRLLKNPLVVVAIIWAAYCFIEILNYQFGGIINWIADFRQMALYFIFFIAATQLFLTKAKHLRIFLIIWSVLTLFAIGKVLMQKYWGFDSGERHWLYVEGAARTHIIYSGIRYFSFFTDAATFGCGMALSMVVFAVSTFYISSKKLKVLFTITAIGSAYAALLSGTRTAMVVPFASFGFFLFISRNRKIIIATITILVTAFCFFYFTTIGNSFSYVRRMRTAFHPLHDSSYLVRLENQRKIQRQYLYKRPFGLGLGTSKPSRYVSNKVIHIPTDSWFVMIWVETGIVGLLLYLGLFAIIFIRGSMLIFKLKIKELRGISLALLSGVFGMLVASYTNEVFTQFPNGPLIYMSLGFIFMAPHFEKELQAKQHQSIEEV